MDEKNGIILSAEEEQRLLAPINEYVGSIQEKVNALRLDGTDRVVALNTPPTTRKRKKRRFSLQTARLLRKRKPWRPPTVRRFDRWSMTQRHT